jgi:hypothetical protein
MLRLAVNGIDETARRNLAVRLRHAALVNAGDAEALICLAATTPADVQSFLDAGKPVLISADFCLADQQLVQFFQRSPADGGPLILNSDHFLPSRGLLHQQLKSGKLGELGLLRLHRWQPCDAQPASINDLPVALVLDVELVLWYAGRSPDVVFAVERADEQQSASTFLQLHFGLPGGAMALLDYARRLPGGEGYDSLSLIGSSGAAYADDHQNMQLAYGGGRPLALRTEQRDGQLAVMAQRFVDAVRSGSAGAEPEGRVWPDVMRIAEALRGSLASGDSVFLETS